MLNQNLMAQIEALHSGEGRGYHGWSHPLALLKLWDQVQGDLIDPLAVKCAILLHDAIYEPRATDNEERSARLAEDLLAPHIKSVTLGRVVRLIEATARHAIPADLPTKEISDMAMFLDMDLSILGASDAIFDAYETGVRHEYKEIPIELFNKGRAAILQGFLARDQLYLSDWGYERFEAKARANLARSIEALLIAT
jgi:predicted metal-dependent HD superfamily phosphohydrolase